MNFFTSLCNVAKTASKWIVKNPDKVVSAAEKGFEIHNSRKVKMKSEGQNTDVNNSFDVKFSQCEQDLHSLKQLVESIRVDSEDFELFVLDQNKKLEIEISGLRERFENEVERRKKQFVIQNVGFGACVIISIIIALIL